LPPSSIGQFRSTTASLADDPEHRSLVDALENGSVEFRAIWQSRRLADAPDWRKTFRHPEAGEVTFRYSTLRPIGPDSPFRVTIYTPASPHDAARFSAALAKRGRQPPSGAERPAAAGDHGMMRRRRRSAKVRANISSVST
jgi:hypothetical protein